MTTYTFTAVKTWIAGEIFDEGDANAYISQNTGFLHDPPHVIAYFTGNQTMADNVFTTLTWNAEIVDNDVMHDNAVNNHRFTVQTPGRYSFHANISINGTGVPGGVRVVADDGAAKVLAGQRTGDNYQHLSAGVSTTHSLSVGDFMYGHMWDNWDALDRACSDNCDDPDDPDYIDREVAKRDGRLF